MWLDFTTVCSIYIYIFFSSMQLWCVCQELMREKYMVMFWYFPFLLFFLLYLIHRFDWSTQALNESVLYAHVWRKSYVHIILYSQCMYTCDIFIRPKKAKISISIDSQKGKFWSHAEQIEIFYVICSHLDDFSLY